jgi:hypothetical protein
MQDEKANVVVVAFDVKALQELFFVHSFLRTGHLAKSAPFHGSGRGPLPRSFFLTAFPNKQKPSPTPSSNFVLRLPQEAIKDHESRSFEATNPLISSLSV